MTSRHPRHLSQTKTDLTHWDRFQLKSIKTSVKYHIFYQNKITKYQFEIIISYSAPNVKRRAVHRLFTDKNPVKRISSTNLLHLSPHIPSENHAYFHLQVALQNSSMLF